MISIEYFFKKINPYKILFYTLIYKYLFCYISFIIFIYGLSYNKIDLCCGHNTKFWDIITCIFFYNLLIISIFTFINILLISINIYYFNKINNNIKNNEKIEYLNKIKKINKYEILIIIFSFILLISILFIHKFLTDTNFFHGPFYPFILTVILGIFPISILEILYYYEKKRENIIKTNNYIEK